MTRLDGLVRSVDGDLIEPDPASDRPDWIGPPRTRCPHHGERRTPTGVCVPCKAETIAGHPHPTPAPLTRAGITRLRAALTTHRKDPTP